MNDDVPIEVEQALSAQPRTTPAEQAALLDWSREAIVVYDREFRFLYLNAEAQRQMQRSPDEVLGRVIWEIFPDTAAPFRETLTRAMQERALLVFEAEYAPSGIWTEGRCVPLGGPVTEDGEPALAVFFRDMTDRHAAERSRAAQQDAEARMRFALEAAQMAAWEWDLAALADPVQDMKAAVVRADHLSRAASDSMGAFLERLHPDDRNAVREALRGVVTDPAVTDYQTEFRVRQADDTYRWMAARGRIARDAGRALRITGVRWDVHARKQAEAQLATAYHREALLNEIGRANRLSSNAREIQAFTVTALGKTIGADRCFFNFFDPAQDTISIEADWHREGLPSLAGAYPLSQVQSVILDDLFRHGATVQVNDVRASFLAPATAAFLEQRGYRALLTTPFYSHGELRAVLALVITDAPRAWTADELTLVEAVASQTRAAVEAARAQEREHNIASQLQEALQPPVPVRMVGLRLAGYYKPALEEAGVGGDFSDVFSSDKGVTYLVVGDVSGKGLAAARQVSTLRNMLRFALLNGRSVVGPVAGLNHTLCRHNLLTGFATLFVARYESGTRTLTYVNGGQESALIRRTATEQVEELSTTGPVLGMSENADYAERSVTLAPGDVFTAFTDGLTEAGQTHRKLVGIDGIMTLLREIAPEGDLPSLVLRLVAGVNDMARGGIRDDICVLAGLAE